MRFTLDSNILVRAATSPRGPALRLLDIILGAHTLVLSSRNRSSLLQQVAQSLQVCHNANPAFGAEAPDLR